MGAFISTSAFKLLLWMTAKINLISSIYTFIIFFYFDNMASYAMISSGILWVLMYQISRLKSFWLIKATVWEVRKCSSLDWHLHNYLHSFVSYLTSSHLSLKWKGYKESNFRPLRYFQVLSWTNSILVWEEELTPSWFLGHVILLLLEIHENLALRDTLTSFLHTLN